MQTTYNSPNPVFAQLLEDSQPDSYVRELYGFGHRNALLGDTDITDSAPQGLPGAPTPQTGVIMPSRPTPAIMPKRKPHAIAK